MGVLASQAVVIEATAGAEGLCEVSGSTAEVATGKRGRVSLGKGRLTKNTVAMLPFFGR